MGVVEGVLTMLCSRALADLEVVGEMGRVKLMKYDFAS